MHETLNVNVPLTKLRREKALVIKKLKGSEKHEFAKLEDYYEELR